jgi:DNA repair exonuclease SbcCD nuclease subunit
MKIAIVTDTHWGIRNDSIVFAEFQNRFFREIFFPYVKEHKIKRIIHLGDLVDRRKYINYLTLKNINDNFFQPIIDNDIEIDIIAGNHDTFYKNTNDVNSLRQLYSNNSYKKINLHWNNTKELDIDGCKIMLCPWICDENQSQILEDMKTTKSQILMGHFEIEGFEMHKGTVCEHGHKRELFEKFDLVMSGHFHHRSSYNNIYYLGTPYEMTWNDYNDQKGFHVFDTKTRKLEFIKNPIRSFHIIEYDDKDMTVEDVSELDTSVLKNTIVKIIIKSKNNPYIFDLFIDNVLNSGASDVKIVDNTLLTQTTEDSSTTEGQDTMTIMKNYINELELKTDKKIISKELIKLYQEAINL